MEEFFQSDMRHPEKLIDPRKDSKSPLIRRSALGLVGVYNMLPPKVVAMKSVSAFQTALQDIIITYAASGHPQWSEVLSPRLPLATRPLVKYSWVAPAFDSESATLLLT